MQSKLVLTPKEETILKEITVAKSIEDLTELKYGMALLKVSIIQQL